MNADARMMFEGLRNIAIAAAWRVKRFELGGCDLPDLRSESQRRQWDLITLKRRLACKEARRMALLSSYRRRREVADKQKRLLSPKPQRRI